jgi:hypothetical protein
MLDTLKICKEKNHEDASYKLYELINSEFQVIATTTLDYLEEVLLKSFTIYLQKITVLKKILLYGQLMIDMYLQKVIYQIS